MRAFLEDGDERLCLVEKVRRPGDLPRSRRAGIGDVFLTKHFNSYKVGDDMNAELEKQWSQVESVVVPPVRSWANGVETEYSRDAARILASLHFARSFAFDLGLRNVTKSVLADALDTWPQDDHLRDAWSAYRPDEFSADALHPLILQRMASEFGPQSEWRARRMVDHYTRCIERLRPLTVQGFTPANRRIDFILGDIPFVLAGVGAMKVGAQNLALGDAETLYMPLGPRWAVLFSREPEVDGVADTVAVQRFNLLTWRGAMQQVAHHPRTDLARALGSSPASLV